MRCKFCGKQISGESIYCSFCGKKTENFNIKPDQDKPEKNIFSKKWWRYRKMTENDVSYSGGLLLLLGIILRSDIGRIFVLVGIILLIVGIVERKRRNKNV